MENHSAIYFLYQNDSHFFLAANPQTPAFLIVLLLALLLLTFTISGAEVALFSLNSKDVNMLKTKQHDAARRIVRLLEEPKEVYSSLLISSTFINICIIVLSNFLIDQFNFLPKENYLIEILFKVVTIGFVLIFFGEIFPKVWATQNNLRFAYGASYIVESLHLLLRRISVSTVKLANNIGKKLGADKSEVVSIKELDQAIDIKTDDETSQEEKNIMKGIVKFANISVKQIMRSRLDIHGADFNWTFDELIKKVEEFHYSRLPVYKNNLDEVTGIINTKDLIPYLNETGNFDWHSLMRQPYFVPESKLIEDLLKDFQAKKIHFAVVVDEFGGTSGIVTMEDILEEVIGDINDEFDEEMNLNHKLDDNNFIFDGKTMLNDVCRMMKLPIDTFDQVRGNSESLAGLILELSGEFPEVNTVIPCGDFQFTILDTENNRIRQAKVTILIK
ncbi:MAG: gliding motility-associated protein GldE [Bacteroidetes bacterium]|nr:gliding motility-associated protein GldE [Bacteroidota bacterium]MBS1931685.1 gliding motility-associated protein GldE [Bacteroidota bacterium]